MAIALGNGMCPQENMERYKFPRMWLLLYFVHVSSSKKKKYPICYHLKCIWSEISVLIFWKFNISDQRPYSKFWTVFEEYWRFYNARKLCDFALKNGIRMARPKCLVTRADDVVLWTRLRVAIWQRVRKFVEEGDIASLAPLTNRLRGQGLFFTSLVLSNWGVKKASHDMFFKLLVS